MIDWISGKHFKKTQILSQVIVSSAFFATMDNKIFQNVIASLYEEFIIIQNKVRKYQVKKTNISILITFEFEVLFEVLRFQQENGWLGAPRSIKFIYNQNWIQLKNSSIPKEISLWIDKLTLKLNQKSFHDYYQAIKRIGKGGFASVYLVKKKHNHEQIAVKAFSKQLLSEESHGLECLQKQINIMRNLSHPNLMKLFQVYETQNSYYLCLQLLSGGSLADRIRKRSKMMSYEIKQIMKSILEGLKYMHSKNIMHRDLKPDNILFKNIESDQCVIADFGLGQNAKNKDFLFSRCGTPGYVAPEIANLKTSSERYTVACDMFSLGVIFHLLATKKTPFKGKSFNQLLIKNRNCQIDFTNDQYQNLPNSWLDLMMKMLQKDPKKRITASKALEHSFFLEEEIFKEFVENRRRQSREKCKSGSKKKISSPTSCNSNILLSSNQQIKKNAKLLEDSCLQFRMQENIITGKIQSSQQNLNQIESPLIVKKGSAVKAESRFKLRS